MADVPLDSSSPALPAAPDPHDLLAQCTQQLAAVMRTWDALRLTADRDALLVTIAQAAHDTLGFGVVVVNVVDDAQQQVTVRAHAGLNSAARAALEGATYPWSTFAQLLDPRFRHGSCYFIPAGALDWSQSLGDAVYIPTTSPSGSDNRWQAEDALFVAIERRDGQVVGVISVDEPRDGLRPTGEALQVLDIFSAQAAIALENAQVYAQLLDAHRTALRQLATPLIPLTDHTLLLPLVGNIDAVRAQQVGDDMLAGVAARRATTLILDLTGVPTLDEDAAAALARTVQAAQLLGTRVVFTGIHPALAQVLLVVGGPLGSVRTFGTVQQGIAAVLASDGAPGTRGTRDA